jgi:hypothetical protein
MKILPNGVIKMKQPTPDKCKGCNHFMKIIKECSFTHNGVAYLEECLCYECLVKPICETVCNPLRKQVGSIKSDAIEHLRRIHDV